MKFDDRGVLDSVEFKIWNLNAKYEWKQVKLLFRLECILLFYP